MITVVEVMVTGGGEFCGVCRSTFGDREGVMVWRDVREGQFQISSKKRNKERVSIYIY